MFPVNKRIWKKKRFSEEIPAVTDLSPLVLKVLLNRGVKEPEKIASFLHPSLNNLTEPSLIKEMERASERICRAIKKKEKICIYGDYDADGLCASAILYEFLTLHDANPVIFIPHRLKHGYGFHPEVVEKLHRKNVSVIITADCGTNSHEACERARELGIDVIVTDHHLPHGRNPRVFAILNPSIPESGFRYPNLCGAGVAFYLCVGLRKYMRERGMYNGGKEPNLKSFLDLVAIATVVDVAPLTGENRIFTKIGLEVLKRTKREGLKALARESGISLEKVNPFHIGFVIGPRLNAAGRISEPLSALQLLLTRNPSEAVRIARDLNIKNQERQTVEKEILKDALEMLTDIPDTDPVIFLYSEKWHPGVIGIVASKLVEQFYRPVILGGKDGNIVRFSARSTDEIHITQLLRRFEILTLSLGGHASAAGFVVEEKRVREFKDSLLDFARKNLKINLPVIEYDEEINPASLSPEDVKSFSALEPFGEGNPPPIFLARKVKLLNPRKAKGGFVYTLIDEKKGFRLFADECVPAGDAEILYTPFINSKEDRISLRMVDAKSL